MEHRASILAKADEAINEFLAAQDSSNSPVRLIGQFSNRMIDPDAFFESVKSITNRVLNCVAQWDPTATTTLLSINRFPGRLSYFALDINNSTYVYETAHLTTIPTPIHILRLSKNARIFRSQRHDKSIAETLARLHYMHGQDPLPFFDDRTTPPVFNSPRGWRLPSVSAISFN